MVARLTPRTCGEIELTAGAGTRSSSQPGKGESKSLRILTSWRYNKGDDAATKEAGGGMAHALNRENCSTIFTSEGEPARRRYRFGCIRPSPVRSGGSWLTIQVGGHAQNGRLDYSTKRWPSP